MRYDTGILRERSADSVSLPGYRHPQILWQRDGFALVRAQLASSAAHHLLKLAVDGLPERATQLRFEQAQLAAAGFPGRARVSRLGELPALVMEISDVQPLGAWLAAEPRPPRLVAHVFALIAGDIGKLHDANTCHGAIDADNVLLLEGGTRPLLIGHSDRADKHPDQDIRDLGACLYQALTGRAPFPGPSSLERRHAAEANAVLPPHDVADVPGYMSALTMRLLSRGHPQRYRVLSTARLDLEQFAHGGTAEDRLGTHANLLGRLLHARELHGREHQLASLRAALAECRREGPRVAVLRGPTGTGKTALANAFLKSCAEQGIRVASSKFDQFQRRLSTDGITRLLTALVREVLGQETDVVEAWKRTLVTRVGPAAAVLVDVVPDLASILEELPAPERLGPTETHSRIMRAVVGLVSTMTDSEAPTVLFVDDVQWADSVSVAVLRTLATSDRVGALLVIAGYRTGENDESPASREAVDALCAAPSARAIAVGDLDETSMTRWLTDLLGAPAKTTRPIARIFVHKTGGNPLFARRLFHHLIHEGALTLDPETHRWCVDLTVLQSAEISNNLLTLVSSSIASLAPDTQRLLHHAACLGHQFSWKDLKLTSPMPLSATKTAVLDAIRLGLLAVIESNATDAPAGTEAWLNAWDDATLRFQHDQIQHAAYASRSADETIARHAHIGATFAASMTPRQLESRIFEVVGHLNRMGNDLYSEEQQRLILKLNLTASAIAHRATEYTTSRSYLQRAFECLGPDCWTRVPALCREIHLKRAAAEYLAGSDAVAEQLLSVALEHSSTAIERAQVHEIALAHLTVHGRYEAALERGQQALSLLGYELDADASADAAARIDELLQTGHLSRLQSAEAMAEPTATLAMAVLNNMLPLTFIANPSLFPAVAGRAVTLSLDEGPAPQSAIGFAAYGILLAAQDRYRDASRFGELALQLATRFGDLSQRCRAGEIVLACIHHWNAPLAECMTLAETALEAGMQSGDLQYAGYVLLYDVVNRLAAGEPLETLAARTGKALELCRDTSNQIACDVLDGCELLLSLYRDGRTAAQSDRERAYLDRCDANGSELALQIYHSFATQHAFVVGDVELAREHAAQATSRNASAPGVITLAVLDLYRALVAASDSHDHSGASESNARDTAASRIASWARLAPANFAHKSALIDAELARAAGQTQLAMQRYDEAIRLAGDQGFIHEQALALELAADFYDGAGAARVAHELRLSALRLWTEWGATSHADALAHRHQLRSESTTAIATAELTETADATTEALLRASRALSGELELEGLLRQLVHTSMLFSGFERTTLLLRQDDELVPRTVCTGRGGPETVVPGDPAAAPELPMTMLRWACRSGQTARFRARSWSSDFANDPYLRAHSPVAAVAIPWMHQGESVAVLYLENRVEERVLEPRRARDLELLGAQGAQSIKNALLYQSLREEIDERSRAELKLARAAREKDVLLQELDHRVKNSLQAMSAVLALSMANSTSTEVKHALTASQQRIHAMASVHDHLSHCLKYGDEDFVNYVRQLVTSTVHAYCREQRPASVDLRIETVPVDLPLAGPCGLILHELISNSCKHCAPRDLQLTVDVRSDGRDLVIVVADNGSGDERVFTDSTRHSTGMKIVAAMTAQLRGTMNVRRDRGLVFELRVPAALSAKAVPSE